MERVVDISTDGLHLAVHRGFLVVSKDHQETGRIALDDIGAVIAHAHGLTWSNNLFVQLAERSVPVVICSSNHAPVTCLWPLAGHYMQGARMRAQANAAKPLKKQLWQKIVMAKITMQGLVLESTGAEAGAFSLLARKVRSGDPDNVEAQAARRYWQALMGPDFRRDSNSGDLNALLNYGYTVLRAVISRAICSAGLHPTLGIFHSNRANAFALADDLMEPYRPLVDRMVRNMADMGKAHVDAEAKRQLAGIATLDLDTNEGVSPLSVQAGRFVYSVASAFETGNITLDLPRAPSKMALAMLGRNEAVLEKNQE
ncbi:type II CRISPR-associated endonuclease Cas1 [Aquamicrobium segne]|uniref:CRISPR-associated endonuclease Cas1 n=1 Tax=Aquamicrobium segne TaxID=469547 RepID=A0ABW0H3W9_9HYPH